jgi:site-specific recombinase XerD
MTLREIQQAGSNLKEDPSWAEDFRRALSAEDLALATVRAYCGDLGSFFRWYAPRAIEALTTVDLIGYHS